MRLRNIILPLFVSLFVFSSVPSYTVSASSDHSLHSDRKNTVVVSGSAQDAANAAEFVRMTFSSEQLPEESFLGLQHRERWFYTFKNDARLTVKAAKPVCQLYFQFEKPCRWTLTLPDGTVRNGGEYGMIHEYVDLGQSVSEFTVDVPEGAVFTGLFGFTEGETPEWVQKWLPPCDTADLMVMPTHSDDEFLWFGGALPYYAGELGYNVQVVYMTNHYNNSIREHERLNALWTVGVRHYPLVCDLFTDWFETKRYDWAVKKFGYDNVLAFQVETLRRFRPKVVIGHDIDGEYGHGVHILNSKTLLEALGLTNDPKAFPESAEQYGLCSVQKCYLHLWNENKIVVNWEKMRLSHFDNRTAMAMADEGYKKNASQYNFYSNPSQGLYDCRLFGLAYTTVGYDTPGMNDMFEHVDRSEQTRISPEETEVSATDTSSEVPEAIVKNPTSFVSLRLLIVLAGCVVVAAALLAGLLRLLNRKKSEATDS